MISFTVDGCDDVVEIIAMEDINSNQSLLLNITAYPVDYIRMTIF